MHRQKIQFPTLHHTKILRHMKKNGVKSNKYIIAQQKNPAKNIFSFDQDSKVSIFFPFAQELSPSLITRGAQFINTSNLNNSSHKDQLRKVQFAYLFNRSQSPEHKFDKKY